MAINVYSTYLFSIFLVACGWVCPLMGDSVVVFNEIMYHPAPTQFEGEWIELHNQMAVDVDISGWSIKGSVKYTFPEGTFMVGGDYLVIAENPAAMESASGVTGVLGPYDGQLSNSGELLRLENNAGRLMDETEYNDKGDWPVAPDGSGVSLSKKMNDQSSAQAENWTWSNHVEGTPGSENFPVVDLRPRRLDLVAKNDSCRYNIQGGDLGQAWRQTTYNDSSWQQGDAGFYYGENLLGSEPETIQTLFSSGLDETGNLLSTGLQDPHYQFVASGNQVIAMQNHPAWLGNDATSQWIGFSGQGTDSQAAGQFNMATTFDLTGFDPTTAAITLYLAVDNRVDDILINGVSTGISCADYANWYGPYVISSGFIEGLNELVFVYVNEGASSNPGGMRIKMDGTAIAFQGKTELASCPLTSYFRTSFMYEIPDSIMLELLLEGLVDDGAVFYLNNTEIYRTNMPTGTIDYNDAAAGNVTELQTTGEITLPADALVEGFNVLAVEVHQAVGGQNDLFYLADLSVTETPIAPRDGLKLAFNEIAADSESSFWLEIVNYGSEAMHLSGVVIVSAGTVNAQYVHPPGTLVAGACRVLTEAELGFHPAAGDRLFLYAPMQTSVQDAVIVKDVLQGRLTTGLTRWYYPQIASPGQTNSISLNSDIVINEIMYHKGDVFGSPGEYQRKVLVPAGTDVSVTVPSNYSIGLDWTGGNEPFDDSSWAAGKTGIGYDLESDYDPDIGIDIKSDIYKIRKSFYARIPFNRASASVIDTMTLRIKYDDGFVAYLNGQKIAERNAPGYPAWNSEAQNSHESNDYETIDVSDYSGYLRAGENILAIHGLNYDLSSSDMLILPELEIYEEIGAAVAPGESAEEWIELYNRGSGPVNLVGWKIIGDIDYNFEVDTVLGAGEYLVVARDSASLLLKYPLITVIGDYQGRLSNSSGKIMLLDVNKNVGDEVVYYDATPWSETADGYNASLELRHPGADNTNAQSWCASDESSKSRWNTYTYRGVAQASSVSEPDGQWREFVMGMLDAGQVLLDDISVIEDPDGTAIELIQNGTFETSSGDDKWRILGTHRHTEVIVDPESGSNHVLLFVATGPTEHMHNHLETTLADGRSITNGQEYEITFRAKWISGSNQLNTRLYFNRMAKTTLIDKPYLNGTPGGKNSCYESNPGPVFSNLLHQPAVPKDYEPVLVSVCTSDPDGLSAVMLYWRLDGQTWNAVSMASQGQGVFSGSIPTQSSASVVQFYVRSVDFNGAFSMCPQDGSDSRALYQVEDGRAATNGLDNLRIVMTAQDDAWIHADINLMSNDRIGATVISNEEEIFYDVGVRLKSSQHHRMVASDVGFNVAFHADQLFRGVHKTVAIDRSQGNGTGQREMLINQMMNHAGTVVTKYSDLIKVISPRAEHTSAAEMQLARFNDEYLNGQFDNGSDGYLYEYEFVYYPRYTIGGQEDYKLPQNDGVVWNNPIVSMGQDKENYRWTYLGKNNRAGDSFDQLIEFTEAFGDSSPAFYDNLEDFIDVDLWLSSFAISVASGTVDNYGGDGSGHNAMLYVRPSDGRVLYFPHDLDFFSGSPNSPSIIHNDDLDKMIVVAGYERLYYGYLYYLLSSSYNYTYMSHWTDHFGQLTGQDFESYLIFIDQRSQYLLGQINGRVAPQYSFEITDPDMSVDSELAQVTGKAWIDVHEIYLDGIDSPLQLEWTSQGTGSAKVFYWEATVPLEPGVNELPFKAYGFNGQLVGQDTIIITSTMQERPLREFLKVTEIMYDPIVDTDYEFVELSNTGPLVLDLTYVIFSEGIDFAFASSAITELNPGDSVVVVKDAVAFSARYDTASMNIAGEFSGKLSNSGETLALLGKWNAPVFSLTYNDTRGWPLAADGAGHSLVPRETASNYSPDYCASWRASTYINGSPGQSDPACPESVLLNEISAHTDYSNPAQPEYDSNDSIELYNLTLTPHTLTAGHWYLSDDADNLKKWMVPQTTIDAGGVVYFDEVSGFHNPITTGFGLDKAGEQVYLSYLPGTWEDRVVDCIRFKGQENAVSLGRSPDGGTYWQAMLPSMNALNLSPLPNVVVSEIMYHPLDGQFEFIELYNPTAQAVSLWDSETDSGWRLDGGVSFTFTSGMSVPAGGHLIIVPFDPEETLGNQLVSDYGPALSVIVGPYAGSLSNRSGRVAIEKPEQADLVGESNLWVVIDEVIYSDQSPWSLHADGVGESLWRSGLTLPGCDPDAWSSSAPSPGTIACDFNADGEVNLSDWEILSQGWMMIPDGLGHILKGDLQKTDDEILIDINDVKILLENWLWENGE